jgi:Rap1a immunity proteins
MQHCEKLEVYWRQQRTDYLPNQLGPALCYGYILAFSALQHISGFEATNCYQTPEGKIVGGPKCRPILNFCVPKGVLLNQELAVFLAYARNHVAQWHESAGSHYLLAMLTAFPCKDE